MSLESTTRHVSTGFQIIIAECVSGWVNSGGATIGLEQTAEPSAAFNGCWSRQVAWLARRDCVQWQIIPSLMWPLFVVMFNVLANDVL